MFWMVYSRSLGLIFNKTSRDWGWYFFGTMHNAKQIRAALTAARKDAPDAEALPMSQVRSRFAVHYQP